MSSITAGTYPESVGSCHPPTPPSPPPHYPAPPSAIHGAPLRRRFDFFDASSGSDLDDDDFIRAVEYIERAPPCICKRGNCVVERDEQRGRWVYVCPSQPGHGACSYMMRVVAAVNEPTQTGTMGDEHLKVNHKKEANENNLVQAEEDKDINGPVNPSQPVEKEAHGNNLLQTGDNIANGSVNSPQSDDECPVDVVSNEIVLAAQTTPSAEVCQASPSMKCETTAMAEAPRNSPVPPYGTSSPINPRSENRVSPTGWILKACGELMISCCSGLCAP
ncbi:hypothetical protein PVAP13_5KG157600 [Panicum virgatum]|uniref:Uncharacterized protein n=1 Tax=Panicum virgatum TaxID=38727 RepID=A0A8T0SIJ1_PANVG|nr:hypothetical protein PVAP13_5KG157600 [Panicum virgatum]